MARAAQPMLDPSRDAASLLGRIGFILLFAAWPAAALLGPSGVLVVLPVAAALIGLQAVLTGGAGPIAARLQRLARSPALAAAALLLAWSLVSLAWSPAAKSGAPRLLAAASVLALALAAYLALPDRMRSANLYLLPVGVLVGAGLAIGLGIASGTATPETARRIERALAILAILAWPSIGWLRSRARDVEAVGLGLLVAVASVLVPDTAPSLAMACGALGYLVAQVAGGRAALGLGLVMATLVLAAPLLGLALPAGGAAAAALSAWRELVLASPLGLLPGHGFGALPPFSPVMSAPGAPLLDLWFELGLAGAAALAAALVLGLRAAGSREPVLVPAITATFATAFALSLTGIDRGEAWWPATLAAAGLAFVAAERGQFRTRRPRARIPGRPRAR